jgi:hypothetical protein
MTQTDSNPRARRDAGAENNIVDILSVQQAIPADRLLDFLDLLNWSALRLLQDALLDGDVHYWQRRARQFEDARRKPGDYQPPHLQVTEGGRAQRDRDLAETALACRNKAEFVRRYGDPELVGAASIVLAGLMDDYREAAA